jgi:hypothetical protein
MLHQSNHIVSDVDYAKSKNTDKKWFLQHTHDGERAKLIVSLHPSVFWALLSRPFTPLAVTRLISAVMGNKMKGVMGSLRRTSFARLRKPTNACCRPRHSEK